MFEVELTIFIKMYLALNNLQMLICHKTQPTNQPTQPSVIRDTKKVFFRLSTIQTVRQNQEEREEDLKDFVRVSLAARERSLDPSSKPRRCPWCSRYRRRKWTRRLEFKSWTRLIAFHIALIPLGKVWIQLFSHQLWENSRTD